VLDLDVEWVYQAIVRSGA